MHTNRAGRFGLAALAAVATASVAQAEGLPKTLAWTAYDVGSSGYSQAVAIGAALKNERGVTMRILPGKNDVSRLVPLRDGKVQFSAFGIGVLQATDAADTFGEKGWGPQEIELLSMSNPDSCAHLITAGDVGVTKMSDFRGKRVAWLKGAPGPQSLVQGLLQFGGLTWDDVEKVEYGGYAAQFDGIVQNQVDAALTVTTAGVAIKVFTSPRGATWVRLPHSDEAAWARMLKATPFYYKQICREGADITEPFEGVSYPYPVLVAYKSQSDDLVYEMTKAMYELYPSYKDSAPGSSGWGLDRQVMKWSMAFHDGAIRYYKEVGRWTPDIQANNDAQRARQKLIIDTWKSYTASAPEDEAAFSKGWQKARLAALEGAGLNPIWRDW